MISLLLFSVVFAALAGILFSSRVFGVKEGKLPDKSIDKISQVRGDTPYENLFIEAGEKYGVPWQLLSAISFVESTYNKDAINFADNQSIGLMQILCRPDNKGGCEKLDSDFDGIDRSQWRKTDLFEPEYNIDKGALILSSGIKLYGVKKGIAVYNSLSARKSSPKGTFPNQSYVNKVLAKARELGYAP